MLVGKHGAEILCSIFDKGDDFLLVDEVDGDGVDRALESAWKQRSQVVFEVLVGRLLSLLCQESLCHAILHIVDVLVKETHDFEGPVQLSLGYLGNGAHLLDSILDLIHQDRLLAHDLGRC